MQQRGTESQEEHSSDERLYKWMDVRVKIYLCEDVMEFFSL